MPTWSDEILRTCRSRGLRRRPGEGRSRGSALLRPDIDGGALMAHGIGAAIEVRLHSSSAAPAGDALTPPRLRGTSPMEISTTVAGARRPPSPRTPESGAGDPRPLSKVTGRRRGLPQYPRPDAGEDTHRAGVPAGHRGSRTPPWQPGAARHGQGRRRYVLDVVRSRAPRCSTTRKTSEPGTYRALATVRRLGTDKPPAGRARRGWLAPLGSLMPT